MRARPPLALAARLAAPGSDDATMTDPDGRAPEETNEPGPADVDEPDVEEADADEADEGLDDDRGELDEAAQLGEDAEAPSSAAVPSSASVPGAKGGRAAEAGGAGRRFGRRGATEPEHVQTVSERAVHIDDRISKIFVIGIAAIFGLIFLNALFLGKGGLFTAAPTPTPVASATPAPSLTAAPSLTPAPSGSPAASASPSAAPSEAPASATPAP